MRAPSGGMNMDNGDRNSDCNSGDISYDGMQPTISFLCRDFGKNLSAQHVCIFLFFHFYDRFVRLALQVFDVIPLATIHLKDGGKEVIR